MPAKTMDIEKQVAYWKTGSDEDIAAARYLVQGGHWRQALFWAHLALEKMLKAHVTRHTGDVPPRIHNLVELAEMARLPLDDKRRVQLREFDVYQMDGRYPIAGAERLDSETAQQDMDRAEELGRWLRQQLPM